MRLYRIPWSHYCQKIEWTFTYYGMAYDVVDIPIWKMKHVTSIHPGGTVPMLETKELITDSHDIMAWLHESHPELYPPGAAEWEQSVNELGEAVRRDVYRLAYQQPLLFGKPLPIRLVILAARPMILKILKYYKARRYEETDSALIRAWIGQVCRQLGDKSYLFGDRPCAADFATAALAWPLIWTARSHRYTDHEDWESLVHYLHRVRPKRTSRRRRRGIRNQDWPRLQALPKRASATAN